MIEPHKHLNPDYSVMYISSVIVKLLLKAPAFSLKYDTLFEKVTNIVGRTNERKIRLIILPSLTFLYAIGKIEYNIQTDSLKLSI